MFMTTALERLQSLLPPPADRAARRRRWDWDGTERRLGHPLPQDYKDLVEVYGGGRFDGHLALLVGLPHETDFEISRCNRGRMDDLRDFWSEPDERPAELTADDALVSWADSIDADTVNWLVRPDEPPERWPAVVLHCDLEDCEIYPMTCTELLAGLFAGDIVSETLTHQFELALSHRHADSHFFEAIPPANY